MTFSYLHLLRAGITGEPSFHSPFCHPSFSSVLSFPSFEPGSCHVAPVWPKTGNTAVVSQVLGCRCMPLCLALAGMFILMNCYLISFRILSSEATGVSSLPKPLVAQELWGLAPLMLLLCYRPVSFVLDTYLGT